MAPIERIYEDGADGRCSPGYYVPEAEVERLREILRHCLVCEEKGWLLPRESIERALSDE